MSQHLEKTDPLEGVRVTSLLRALQRAPKPRFPGEEYKIPIIPIDPSVAYSGDDGNEESTLITVVLRAETFAHGKIRWLEWVFPRFWRV